MGKLNRRILKPIISHQELTQLVDKDCCFVCNKKFKQKDWRRIYIGKNSITNEKLYRHDKCAPLSEKWTKKFGNPIIVI